MSDQIPVYQPTAGSPTPRYTVRTDIPRSARAFGIVAWVLDAQHPDDPEGASCCWCMDLADAKRIAAGLNRDEAFRERLRFVIIDEVVGAIEHGEIAR